MTFEDFVAMLSDAYEHLYDLVYLRTHPLTPVLTGGEPGSAKDHAWMVHHLLLESIDEINPGNAPITSREWRRHRLLNLRYADGLAAQAVADQLAISRRHYYRAHDEAIRALASILWNRYPEAATVAETAVAVPVSAAIVEKVSDRTPADRMELMRSEAAQLSHIDQPADITGVLNGILALLEMPLQQHHLKFRVQLSSPPPRVLTDPRLLRQLLLALTAYLIDHAQDGDLICQVTTSEQEVWLQLEIDPTARIPGQLLENPERLTSLEELATLCRVELVPVIDDSRIIGFRVRLPLLKPHATVLVIDDNDDILELVQRYLRFNNYDVVTARNAEQALEKVEGLHPSVIILDLMIPDRDGWDLMQYFLHQPGSRSIPIIVCSVLRQKELALSLGAAAFIEKPVSEQHLIQVLNSVIGTDAS